MLDPRQRSDQRFLDQRLERYADAKRASADGRLGGRGRKQQVAELESRLYQLCQRYGRERAAERRPPEWDFAHRVNELLQRLVDDKWCTFVLEPAVEPTNSFTERLQRGPALDRKAGRTCKSAAGAQGRSVIVSVLESLRANLETFTLASVLTNAPRTGRWVWQLKSCAFSKSRPKSHDFGYPTHVRFGGFI